MATYVAEALNNPELFFQVKLYSGNSSTQTITLDGDENMQPDLVWIKSRNAAQGHSVYDAVRGFTTGTIMNTADIAAASTSEGNGLNGITSDGFTLSGNNSVAGGTNGSGTNYVAWCWKAGNSSGSSNTDGSITSTVSANTTAGFSVVKYNVGSGGNISVGHGLGVAPNLIISRVYDDASNWVVGSDVLQSGGWTKFIELNDSDPIGDETAAWQDTAPTSTVFTTNNAMWGTNVNNIAYCFAEKQGYSKVGSYIGNGNADGTFVYLGFRPAFVLLKCINASSTYWYLYDSKRLGYNVDNNEIYPNVNLAEQTDDRIDFLSNGFKFRNVTGTPNNSSQTNIFMAFAEAPFVNSNGVPCNAR